MVICDMKVVVKISTCGCVLQDCCYDYILLIWRLKVVKAFVKSYVNGACGFWECDY